MSEEHPRTSTKFFKTRVEQELIGRWPGNGDKIPGGPYTLPQIGCGFGAGIFALWSKNIFGWTTGNVLFDSAIAVGIVIGVIYLLKTVVPDEPGLLKMRTIGYATATVSLANRHRTGSYRGRKYDDRPVRHQRTGRVLIDARPTMPAPTQRIVVETTAVATAGTEVTPPTAAAEAAAPASTVRLSGVEHLLASTRH